MPLPPSPLSALSEDAARHYRDSLARALGPEILAALADPDVTEVYVNPDGRLHFDTRSRGRLATPTTVPATQTTRFLNLVASSLPVVLNSSRPHLQAELPWDEPFRNARLQGFVPPLVAAPAFNLRKPPSLIYSLDDYVATGVLPAGHRRLLGEAVRDRRNVLVAGGTASGKTTLVNALLHEIAGACPLDRIVVLEDTVELQCAAPDCLALRTLAALHRLDRLAQRAGAGPQAHLVGDAIHWIVMIAGGSSGRRVTEVARVGGFDGGRYLLNAVAA